MRTRAALAAGLAGGYALGRAVGSPQVRFARMAGLPIAAPDAVGWVTDFINAAYYRRPPETRELDDLRLACYVLTTRWQRGGGRRLRGHDVVAFHRAFGGRRLDGRRSRRGTLCRAELFEGATALLGDWFPEAYGDAARRRWGVVFASEDECAAYAPEARLALARLGPLTPESAPPEQQVWHTYPPVATGSAASTLVAVADAARWPDFASEIGRFTPLRGGGLEGQTFELEVAAGTTAGRPVFTRGYVTVTRLVDGTDPAALDAYVGEVNAGLARWGKDEPPAVPEDAQAILAMDLTTHEGHFMGCGHNRLIAFERDGVAHVRAAGTWDPMPWHLDYAYRMAGRSAQHAFWGHGGREELSMLHQLAAYVRRLDRAPVAA